jgi:hypothetical protein
VSGTHPFDATIEALNVLKVEQHLGEIDHAGCLAFALESRREVEPKEAGWTGMCSILDDIVLAPLLAKEMAYHGYNQGEGQTVRVRPDLFWE